jgi:predicted Zn-dependent protease
MVVAVVLASCGGQSAPSATSSPASNPTASAVAGPRATATPCTSVKCLDDAAYKQEKPNIRPNSPEAKLIAPIAAKIARVVQPVYGAPFYYYVTKSTRPDAYSWYGPRVYISRGMIDYADYREELAGILCHESSHVLHHDGMRSQRATDEDTAKANALVRRAEAMTRNHLRPSIEDLAAWANNLAQLRYSRAQEEAADLSGATVCSQAGFNPWGLVWMLQKIHRDPAMSSGSWGIWNHDHPSDKARIAALRKALSHDAAFKIWTPDMAPNRLRK